VKRRSWHGAICSSLVLVAVLAVASDCSDSENLPTRQSSGDGQQLRDGVVLSGPLGSAAGVSTSGPGGPSTSALAYVSMPPGTLTDGDSIRIANPSVATATVTSPMGAGGFDPVAIEASQGDSLDVSVFRHGQEGEHVFLRVPQLRQPAVIRTSPARGRTDVPLNQAIVIVLSQPLDASTVTTSSVLLTLNDVPVPATVQLQVGQPWVILLSPATPLAPNATYSIVVTTAVLDVNGSAIPAQATSSFTTSASVSPVASISIRASGTYGGEKGTAALASVGGSVTFVASNVSAAGDTLLPDSGQDVIWSSSDQVVATVTSIGEYQNVGNVQTISAGSATISACLDTVCGQGSVTVRAVEFDVAPVLMADLGGPASRVWDMRGEWVTGSSFTSAGGCEHAFLWSASTGAEDLGTLPGECSSISMIIGEGPIVIGLGDYLGATAGYSQWIWRRETGIQRISLPSDDRWSWQASHIDSRGNIEFSDSLRTAIQDENSNFRILDLPTGWQSAGGMNDVNQITIGTDGPTICDNTGFCQGQCGTVGYVWDYSTGRTVYTLEPRDASNTALEICPWRINNAGTVAGSVFIPMHTLSEPSHETPFRWSAQRGFEYPPPFEAGVTAEGHSLNEAGDLTLYLFSYIHIGSDSVYDVSSAVWMADGRVIRLGSLGGDHTAANGINDQHIVVGHSQVGSSTGPQHAVFWDLSTASPSRVAQSSPLAFSARAATTATRDMHTAARDMPPAQVWRRNTIRQWSRVPRP
jgi:hypothetical protein